jgi:putative endonuclease
MGSVTADNRPLGRLGEEIAAAHLERRGYAVLARNARTRHGEIDLVARDGHALVFVEVKTRRALRRGAPDDPLEGIRVRQRLRLRRLAGAWLAANPPRPVPALIRFDAIGVTVDRRGRLLRLDHVEDAW